MTKDKDLDTGNAGGILLGLRSATIFTRTAWTTKASTPFGTVDTG